MKSKQILKFPHGFLWGASTAAHQIEGNNTKSDWWAWEQSVRRVNALRAEGKNPEDFFSGQACDSYNRYEEDFKIAQSLHHNAHRLSIEWARIEPEEGRIDEAELEHYEQVLRSAKYHGLSTFVTLHHFTLPLWFAKKGGFAKKENIFRFVNYVKFVASSLSEYVDFWITINEPEGYASVPFILGLWPPNKRNIFLGLKVALNLARAHNLAVPELKKISNKPVGMANNMVGLEPLGWLSKKITTFFHEKMNNVVFLRTVKNCDFIGLNYYFFHKVGFFGKKAHKEDCHEVSDINWGIHPEGIENVLLSLRQYNKPIYITENGLADAKDAKREKFISEHLFFVHRAIQKGANVKGYLHWSLIDNFEWAQGFFPRFGLVEIDREDLLRRKIRPSALKYAEICENNYLEH